MSETPSTEPSFPRKGELSESSLVDLMEPLLVSGLVGTLALRQDGVVKALFVKQGELVFATSTLRSDRLGEVLMRKGMISESALEAATKSMRETGNREGETLVELGILTPKALFEGLKLQVEEIIVSAFQWDQGTFRFIEGPLPPQVIPLPLYLDQLLPKALDRMSS